MSCFNTDHLPQDIVGTMERGEHGMDADVQIVTELHGAHIRKLKGDRWITCDDRLYEQNKRDDPAAGVAILLSKRAAKQVKAGQKGHIEGPGGSRIVWVRLKGVLHGTVTEAATARPTA